jgi:hypothetical protein
LFKRSLASLKRERSALETHPAQVALRMFGCR